MLEVDIMLKVANVLLFVLYMGTDANLHESGIKHSHLNNMGSALVHHAFTCLPTMNYTDKIQQIVSVLTLMVDNEFTGMVPVMMWLYMLDAIMSIRKCTGHISLCRHLATLIVRSIDYYIHFLRIDVSAAQFIFEREGTNTVITAIRYDIRDKTQSFNIYSIILLILLFILIMHLCLRLAIVCIFIKFWG